MGARPERTWVWSAIGRKTDDKQQRSWLPTLVSAARRPPSPACGIPSARGCMIWKIARASGSGRPARTRRCSGWCCNHPAAATPPRDARPLRESARHWHPVWWRLSRNCGLAHHGTRPPDAVRGVRRSPWIRSGARASPGDTWTRGQLYRSRRSTRGSTAWRLLVSARRRWLLRTVRRCIRIYYTSIVIYLASLRIARKLVTVAPPSADLAGRLKQLALGIPPHTRAPRAAPHACR